MPSEKPHHKAVAFACAAWCIFVALWLRFRLGRARPSPRKEKPIMRTRPFYPSLLALCAAAALVLLLSPWPTIQAAPPNEPNAPTAAITLEPVADASLNSSQPTTNNGQADQLQVTSINNVAQITHVSLLRFDLALLPAGSLIDRATLRLRQLAASGDNWTVNLNRITTFWDENQVTWNSRPASVNFYPELPVPNPNDDPIFTWDVTELVRTWVQGGVANNGFEIVGTPVVGAAFGRSFSSREGIAPPELVIDYTPPPTSLVIAEDLTPVDLDGLCDTANEYARATVARFVDVRGELTTVYLKHDADNLYVCFVAPPGSFGLRSFDLYLDTDFGREKYATEDDYALQVNVPTGDQTMLVGTGNPQQVYAPTAPRGWQVATSREDTRTDRAEFVIDRDLFRRACASPFGLAFFHRFVTDQGVDFGLPPARPYEFPDQWLEATLENPGCIRVCVLTAEPCGIAPGAVARNAATGAIYTLDAEGYVQNRSLIAQGDPLWALMPVTSTATSTLYHTSGDAQAVTSAAFHGASAGTMTLVISPQYPLLVQDLTVSANYYVQTNPAYETTLRQQLRDAAGFFYAFTDGQFTLGEVTINQFYDQWADADLKLHASNSFHPRAVIGGVVLTATVDLDPSVPITYAPGHMYMGWHWNKYGKPPGEEIIVDGQPVSPASMEQDWALALAHEMGHYLLYLFDTYTDVDSNASKELAAQCTGSAMGDVYLPINHAFVFDAEHWNQKCQGTEAYKRLNGRTEWQTIHLWHPWTITPTAYVTGPTLPAGLTQVTVTTPSVAPGVPASQLFDLLYQDNERNSAEARGFILRQDRVLDQGKAAAGSNQIQLMDAQVGDQLCVYDLNDHAEGDETPRHQFGCETIALGDATLVMTKDESWAPLIDFHQSGPQQLILTVTQAVTTPVEARLQVKLYPEHDPLLLTASLNGVDGLYTATLNLTQTVPPLFFQLFVDEVAPTPATRREVVVERGTGGSGAFGPAKHVGGVLVVSTDGNATFESDEPLELKPGESIAWQSMPGTPPLPPNLDILGQSYRLDAYPPALVATGRVSIRYRQPAHLAQAAAAGELRASEPTIYFWNGVQWRALETTRSTPVNAADREQLASASSQGIGVYAVLVDLNQTRLLLPWVSR
jgi:hypothetical protein